LSHATYAQQMNAVK